MHCTVPRGAWVLVYIYIRNGVLELNWQNDLCAHTWTDSSDPKLNHDDETLLLIAPVVMPRSPKITSGFFE